MSRPTLQRIQRGANLVLGGLVLVLSYLAVKHSLDLTPLVWSLGGALISLGLWVILFGRSGRK